MTYDRRGREGMGEVEKGGRGGGVRGRFSYDGRRRACVCAILLAQPRLVRTFGRKVKVGKGEGGGYVGEKEGKGEGGEE